MAVLWKELALWDHQVEAVKLGERYLRDFRKGKTDGWLSYVCRQGTGKTGVMAVPARLLYREIMQRE
ncbi:hypothetical protein ACFL6S_25415 [Candidatus Poribacteria bacterium]